jgi:hypothetical protein
MKTDVTYVRKRFPFLSVFIIVVIGKNMFVCFCSFSCSFNPLMCFAFSGMCVCELCSKDKVRIPRLDERALYKVCNHCSKQLKEDREYGFQSNLVNFQF